MREIEGPPLLLSDVLQFRISLDGPHVLFDDAKIPQRELNKPRPFFDWLFPSYVRRDPGCPA